MSPPMLSRQNSDVAEMEFGKMAYPEKGMLKLDD
jgi:hypothetical protein